MLKRLKVTVFPFTGCGPAAFDISPAEASIGKALKFHGLYSMQKNVIAYPGYFAYASTGLQKILEKRRLTFSYT
jgi:hypothetical protein